MVILSDLKFLNDNRDAILAYWDINSGWYNAEDEEVTSLNEIVLGDEDTPFEAGGDPIVLNIRMSNEDGEVDIAPLSANETEAECDQYSVRYYPGVNHDDTDNIAWPNEVSPDNPDGPERYATRTDDQLVPLYFCDQVRIYPERPGRLNIEFVLWHVNHADQSSDTLDVTIE